MRSEPERRPALTFALPVQWLQVYFVLFSPRPSASPEDGDRYLLTAALALGCLIAAVVVAAVRRRTGLVIGCSALLLCAALVAFVTQVPAGRFIPRPESHTSVEHPVCFGTTGTCPGG